MSQRQTNSTVCFPSTETVPALLPCVPVDRGSDIRQTLDAESGQMSPSSGLSGDY